jgi:hypothetical protein
MMETEATPGALGSNAGLGADDEARDTALGLWVCPWRVCGTEQAQKCRAVTSGDKTHLGCGTVFPHGATLKEARKHINWRDAPNGQANLKPTAPPNHE